MLDFFRDAVWQFVGAILALIALAVTLWLHFKQRDKKILTYNNYVTLPLVRIEETFSDAFKILYLDEEVRSASIAYISIQNAGNTPLRREDFDSPLIISATSDGKISSAHVVRSTPADLKIAHDFTSDKRGVQFDPFLLNPDDRFYIGIIVVDGSVEINATARVIGGQIKMAPQVSKGLKGIIYDSEGNVIWIRVITLVAVGTLSGVLGNALASVSAGIISYMLAN